MKKSIFAFIATSIFGLCASTGAIADDRECATNFTVEGSLMSGRTYKTKAFVSGVFQADALKRAGRDLASVGFQINSTSESMGMISASQTVSYGNGKTAPLNVLVDAVDGGVNVSMTYNTSGGVSSPTDAVRNQFCSTINAISNTTN